MTVQRSRTAFTVVEVLIVASIITTLALVAIPRFTDTFDRARAAAAADRIVSDLTMIRENARTRGVSRSVAFSPGASRYDVVGMPDINHPGRDYRVQLGSTEYDAQIVSANFGGDSTLVFDLFGDPDSGGTVVIRVRGHVRTVTVNADTGIASAN